MDIKSLVLKTVNHTIKNADINGELRAALLRSDKVRTFTQKLYGELLRAQAAQIARGRGYFKASTIENTTRDFTKTFILGVEREAQKKIQSDLARIADEQKVQHKQELEAASDGKFIGEYEELKDVVTTDERST